MSERDVRPPADDAAEAKAAAEVEAARILAVLQSNAEAARKAREEEPPELFDLLLFVGPLLKRAASLFLQTRDMGLEIALIGTRYWWYWPRYRATSEHSFESFGECMLDALRWFYQTNPEEQRQA